MLSGFIYNYSDPDQRFEESMAMDYDSDPTSLQDIDTTTTNYQFLIFSDIQGQTADLLQLKEVLDGMEVKEPMIDFISNIDAEVTRDPEKIKENLVSQLDHRTLWEASVRKAISMGVKDYLEVGPGSVLKSLLRKIDTSLNVTPLHATEDIKSLLVA